MSEKVMANNVYCYTLTDLEQARADERGRLIEKFKENYSNFPVGSENETRGSSFYNWGVFYRKELERICSSLGPISETREEAERRVRRETVEKMCAFIARADLLQFEDEIDAIAEGK